MFQKWKYTFFMYSIHVFNLQSFYIFLCFRLAFSICHQSLSCFQSRSIQIYVTLFLFHLHVEGRLYLWFFFFPAMLKSCLLIISIWNQWFSIIESFLTMWRHQKQERPVYKDHNYNLQNYVKYPRKLAILNTKVLSQYLPKIIVTNTGIVY